MATALSPPAHSQSDPILSQADPILSQADIDRLLTDSSARTRIEVAQNLGRDIDSRSLTSVEIDTAQDIVRVMARDVDAAVRAALSNSLRHSKRLPRDVALALANDVDAVALPVLGAALVLTDDDLLEIVRRGSPARQTAIAGRPSVSEPLAAALVARGGETTVTTLLNNPGARISADSLHLAIDRFPDSDAVKGGIAHRAALPITVTERLVAIVSDRLRDYLVAHHDLPAALAGELALRSRERATLAFGTRLGDDDAAALAAQMRAHGRLTPTLVLRALCIGDMAFFEAATAALAGVPVANARILIHDAGQRGFAALYQKSGLPSDQFAVFRAATEIIDSTNYDGEARDMERFRARVITRLLTVMEKFPPDNLDYLIARLGDVLTPA